MKTITIKEAARESVKPDLIIVSINLESVDIEYQNVLLDDSKKIDILNSSLKEIGFNKESLKTTDFNITTKYENINIKGSYEKVFKGYVCRHHLLLEFSFDTKLLGLVLSALSSSLSNPEIFINFSVKNQEKYKNMLLTKLAQNALEKAKVLCKASGVSLGELVTVDYSINDLNMMSNTNYQLQGRSAGVTSSYKTINIVPEEISISDTATFVWEIIK